MKLIFWDNGQVWTKPDSALLNGNKPFFVPDFAQRFTARQMLTARICKMGRSIAPKFAERYYDAVGVGLDITAQDLLEELKSTSAPWTLAKGFDGSAVVNGWITREKLDSEDFILQNKALLNTKEVIECVIVEVSRYFTLRTGDVIFVARPEWQAFPIQIEDTITAEFAGEELIRMRVK